MALNLRSSPQYFGTSSGFSASSDASARATSLKKFDVQFSNDIIDEDCFRFRIGEECLIFAAVIRTYRSLHWMGMTTYCHIVISSIKTSPTTMPTIMSITFRFNLKIKVFL